MINSYSGKIDKDFAKQISNEEYSREFLVPNIHIDEDLVSKYISNDLDNHIKKKCDDVIVSLNYNLFGYWTGQINYSFLKILQ